MANITDTGYQLKTQNEWFADERARYKAIDPGWNTDPSSPDGLKIAADAEIFANIDEVGQKAYNSKDPAKAVGLDLAILCSITGTTVGEGSPSTVAITITGTDGDTVLSGALIESTADGTQWSVDNDTLISGATAATATAIENGATQASIGTLTKIVNAQSGWGTVTNPSVAVAGTNPDSDSILRIKRNNGVSLPGQNQIDSTYAAIANVDDVRRVRIYENDSQAPVDALGLPFPSTAIFVDGGDDEAIALAIYSKRNPGPKQHTDDIPVSVDIISPTTGNAKTIKFNRPTQVDAVIVVNISNDGSLAAAAAEDEIIAAILLYVSGELLDEDVGFNQAGFAIGEGVPVGRIYTPVNSVIGKYGASFITSITIGGGDLLNIDHNQLARFAEANITVNIS